MKNSYDRREPKIYQSEYGTWKVRFFDDVKSIYRNKNCQTKTAAENLKRAIERGDDLTLWFSKEEEESLDSPKTFKDLSDQWIDHARNVRRISESCLKTYACHLNNHILPVFGGVSIKQLKLSHVEALAKELRTKKPQSKSYLAVRKNRVEEDADVGEALSLSYQREILTVACMITSWAFDRRPSLIPENPFETFKLPEVPEHLYDYWRLEDEDRFFDWIDKGAYYEKETTRYRRLGRKKAIIRLQLRNRDELRDIVLVALRTGMRLGEIGALRNVDVDLAGGFIIVRGSFSQREGIRKNTTKNKKARRIEINDDVRRILARRKHTPQMEPLFNILMNSIKFFSRTCRLAGIKEIHFHSLRHTCLTNLANGYGMERALPLPKVQQIAGHSDIMTTMRYVHNDIINETASLQWSREERKALKADAAVEVASPPGADLSAKVVPIKKGLRLVGSAKNKTTFLNP